MSEKRVTCILFANESGKSFEWFQILFPKNCGIFLKRAWKTYR